MTRQVSASTLSLTGGIKIKSDQVQNDDTYSIIPCKVSAFQLSEEMKYHCVGSSGDSYYDESAATSPISHAQGETHAIFESDPSRIEQSRFSLPSALKSGLSWSSSNNTGGDDMSTSELTTFESSDFQSATWRQVLTTDGQNSLSAMGLAAVMTATVIIHPLVFVTGAATAVWAVGVFHAVGKGYDFFSDGSFKRLFWADKESILNDPSILRSETDSIILPERMVEDITSFSDTIDTKASVELSDFRDHQHDIGSEHGSLDEEHSTHEIRETASPQVEIEIVTPSKPSLQLHDLSSQITLSESNLATSPNSLSRKEDIFSHSAIIKQHFPPLEKKVVENVPFPGLNAIEFFQVFFADNAPYSQHDFQKQRGDTNLNFTKWKQCSDPTPLSLHPNSKAYSTLPAFPTFSKKTRTVNFKTLAKSYFGTTYATAKKTMNVTKVSKCLVIIESKTELFDIPYSDRFFVVERWVLESTKNDCIDDESEFESADSRCRKNSLKEESSVKGPEVALFYTTRLTVHVQVFMLRSCTFEKQIRQRTLSAMIELLNCWCEKATLALELTAKKKMEKIKSGTYDRNSSRSLNTSVHSFTENISANSSNILPQVNPNFDVGETKSKEELLKLHESKFKELQDTMTVEDIESSGIEIRHSISSGSLSAFARIHNMDNDVLSPSTSDVKEASLNSSHQNESGDDRNIISETSSFNNDFGDNLKVIKPKKNRRKRVLGMLKRIKK